MEWSVPGNLLKVMWRAFVGKFFSLLMRIAQYSMPVYLVITNIYFSQQTVTIGHGSSLQVSWNEADATCCDITFLHFTNWWQHLRTPWQFIEKTCDASFHVHCLQACTWKISSNVAAFCILRIFANLNLEGHQEHQNCIECANFFLMQLVSRCQSKGNSMAAWCWECCGIYSIFLDVDLLYDFQLFHDRFTFFASLVSFWFSWV